MTTTATDYALHGQALRGSTLGRKINSISNLMTIVPLWSDRTLIIGQVETKSYRPEFVRYAELTQISGNTWELKNSRGEEMFILISECLEFCFPGDRII